MFPMIVERFKPVNLPLKLSGGVTFGNVHPCVEPGSPLALLYYADPVVSCLNEG